MADEAQRAGRQRRHDEHPRRAGSQVCHPVVPTAQYSVMQQHSPGGRERLQLDHETLLGPEADRIRALVPTEQDINQEADYDDAIEDHRAMGQIAKHATNALSAAGLDGEWWAYQVGCTRGYELVVLAASDLVDKDTEWDEQASQTLMRPWVEAMGCPQAA